MPVVGEEIEAEEVVGLLYGVVCGGGGRGAGGVVGVEGEVGGAGEALGGEGARAGVAADEAAPAVGVAACGLREVVERVAGAGA